MRISVVEDDKMQYESLKDHLEEEFHGATLTRIESARAFRSQLSAMRANLPDIVLIDVMLPWQTVYDAPGAIPSDVNLDDRHLGVRCQQWLAQDGQLCSLPVVLFTELDRTGSLEPELKNLPANVRYLRKDAGYAKLDRLILQLTSLPR